MTQQVSVKRPAPSKSLLRTNSIRIVLFTVPVLIALVSLSFGRYYIPVGTVIDILFHQLFPGEAYWKPVEETVVINIRLPRVLMTLLIGGGLAASGTAFQGLFGNPLVSPNILGVSAGAGFGAALTILLFNNMVLVPVGAMILGLSAVFIAFFISRRGGHATLFMLILSGVITGALFEAMLSLIKYMADPNDTLPTIVFWLMGSLTASSYKNLTWGAPLIIAGLAVLWSLRWRLNVLSLSDIEAESLGTDVKRLRWFVIAAATLVTATTVSLAGIIGWVALVIPHITRMIVGSNHQALMPASVAVGAGYLLLIDTVARNVAATEIPLSILTAVIGAPFFAWLLVRTRGGWS